MIQPPSGFSCASYLDPFVSSAGGYLENPDAGSDCLYCSASTADAWLLRMFNIQYAHRWRNVGLFCAFIAFNVSRFDSILSTLYKLVLMARCQIGAMFAFTYIFRIRSCGRSKAIVKQAISRTQGILKPLKRTPKEDKTSDRDVDETS